MAEKGKFGQENVKAGDNAKFLAHALAIHSWPPVDIDSDEEIEQRLQQYFVFCQENDIKPTVAGMANSLKVSRYTLQDWKTGKRRGSRRQEIIGFYYGLLEELYEDYMMNGKVNPVSGIFMGKNHFGYQDKQEISIKAKQQFNDDIDPEEVKQKYLESTKGLLTEHVEAENLTVEDSEK